MKHKLPILTLTAVLGAGLMVLAGALRDGTTPPENAAPANVHANPNAPTITGNQLLLHAASVVEQYPTLEGRLRQQVQLFGHQLAGTGTYRQQLQQGLFRFRWDLRMATEPIASHYLAVSDGRFLWLRSQSHQRTSLQRIDLKELQEDGDGNRPGPPTRFGSVRTGGLPGLLRRLECQFEMVIEGQTELGRERVPVTVLRGRWKPDILRRTFFPKLSRPLGPKELHRLPDPVPHEVEIVLGRDEALPMFPYRIRFYRVQEHGKINVMTLELFELSRGAPISPHVFRYEPGNEETEDGTEAYRKAWLLESSSSVERRFGGGGAGRQASGRS